MYTDFAHVYDLMMDDVPYADWAQHYLTLLDKYGASKGKCVECACGTGRLTVPLQKAGMKMTGVDLSSQMLEIAMQRAREQGCLIPFIHQNMCDLTVPSRVNAVLCTCDGVNYLTDKKQLSSFFAAAFKALKPGGVLLFDVSTPHKLRDVLGNGTRTYVSDSYSYIWNNMYSSKSARLQLDLTIFVKKENGLYEKLEEKQVQRAHSRDELTEALLQSGFTGVRFYGNMRMNAPRENDLRWHVAAVKKMD